MHRSNTQNAMHNSFSFLTSMAPKILLSQRDLDEEDSRADSDHQARHDALVVLTLGSTGEWDNGLAGRGKGRSGHGAVGGWSDAAGAIGSGANCGRRERGRDTWWLVGEHRSTADGGLGGVLADCQCEARQNSRRIWSDLTTRVPVRDIDAPLGDVVAPVAGTVTVAMLVMVEWTVNMPVPAVLEGADALDEPVTLLTLEAALEAGMV